MLRFTLAIAAALLPAVPLCAEVQTRTIKYQDGDKDLEGFLAWNDAVEGKRPGVLVVHEWWGLNDYARSRAKKLAAQGYVAFALDMYGAGKTTEHPQEAREWATMIRSNTEEWRDRALAGLKVLQSQEQVDAEKIAAIGYCFGGSTVLQMAYAGADLQGVASFHGALPPFEPQDESKIEASILVCHGADDEFIPDESVQAFRESLDQADADYQVIYYSGTRHSFTDPNAGRHGIDNMKYDKKADERSWRTLEQFLQEIFATP